MILNFQVLSTSAPVKTISGLQAISHFHNGQPLRRAGYGTILDALQSSTLTVKILAQATGMCRGSLSARFWVCAGGHPRQSGYQNGRGQTPVYLDISDNLHITPKEITHLLAVSENARHLLYADLTTLAGLLQAGLNEQQTKQLQKPVGTAPQ